MNRALLVAIVLAGCTEPKKLADPNAHDRAQLVTKKYAFEAYPQWAAAHPDKACPAKVSELDEYMRKGDEVDPWGHAYAMQCGPDLPAGARGIAIHSLGPDGKDATADDVRSW